MKNKGKKISAIIIACVVLTGSTLGCVIASETNKTNANCSFAEELVTVPDNDIKEVKEQNPAEPQDEVVYVFADTEGNVNKVMDSIWIKNGEEINQTAEEANLPIRISISYALDNKPIEASELVGRDGHLKIRMDFTDLAFEEREVNGSVEKIYVPFIASAVTVLDGEKFENVEVSTGRVAYDGARYAVVGLALPGLKDDLDLEEDEELDIPEYIEIEADVKDCEIEGMYLLVSNSVFNELDVDTTDKMDELKENVTKIDDAMTKLMDGSDKLYDGLGELLTGAVKLSDGVNTLSDGLGTLNSNSGDLRDGAKKVFESLLAQASQELAKSGIPVGNLTIDNYAKVLSDVIGEGQAMTAVKAAVSAEVEKNNDAIVEQVTAAVNAAMPKAAVEGMIKANPEAMAQIASGVAAAINASQGTGLTGDMVLAAYEGGDASVAAYIDGAVSSAADAKIAETISAKVAETKAGLIASNSEEPYKEANKKISDLKQSLDDYNKFYQGIIAYTDGVGKAYDGSVEMKKKMPEMLEGINTLRDGEKELSDGLNTFNDEAISKVTDLVNDTLEGLVNRFDAVTEVSKNYKAYDTNGEPMKDGVKFIIKIDSIR